MEYKSDNAIITDIKNEKTYPIYFLMGDEAFFIDRVVDYIQNNLLNETEREFDLQVLYGNDVTIEQVVDAAKQFPMMSQRQLIIVREGQMISSLENLTYYVEKPLASTILVIVYRKKLDKRTVLYKSLKKTCAVFESMKLQDKQVGAWIMEHISERGFAIDSRSAELLAEYLGSDLSKISNEVDKLIVGMPAGTKKITGQLIERNIGISKDYNSFELKDALMSRDALKANRIIDHFAKNPSKNPLTLTLAALFATFADLMVLHYLPDKSPNGIAQSLGISSGAAYYRSKELGRYSAGKVFRVIALLRDYDARSKGVGNSSVPQSELLRELVFKIIH